MTDVTNITGVPTTATVGTALTLTGTVVPATATNKTIVWSVASAGATGATCTGAGKLSATAAGTVTVKATITNGDSATSSYTKNFPITVESNILTLSKSRAKVKVGSSGTLTVASGNTQGQAITWTSDDTSIVTINGSSGNYSGKKRGIADITAKTADGTKTGRCKMYVYVDIVTSLGRGINIVDADDVITDFIYSNNPVIDIDMLNVEGKVTQSVDLSSDTKVSISESVLNVVNGFNQKSNVSYVGAFSASAGVNYDTKKTENKTTKFIKAMGFRSIRSESITNTDIGFLKGFLTDQFINDCTSKNARTLLSTYGSHVIAECRWGGIALADAMYTSTKITTSTKLEAVVKASFGGFSTSNTSVSKSEKDHFKRNTVESIKARGGNMSAKTWDEFSSQYASWYSSLDSRPDVCGIKTFNENRTMIPLWRFIKEVSPTKADSVETLFKQDCTDRGVKLKGHIVYIPVVTAVNVFAQSSDYTFIPPPYNRVVLDEFADKQNDAESFEEKKQAKNGSVQDLILDANRNAGGAYINIFYSASQVPDLNGYTGKAISDIIILNGKNINAPAGYTKIGVDLNQGAGSDTDYLYLAYKKATTDPNEKVIDFIGGKVFKTAQLPGLPPVDDGTWHWVPERNSSGFQSMVAADLNKGCGTSSNYIRLLVHKIPKQKDPN